VIFEFEPACRVSPPLGERTVISGGGAIVNVVVL
jgi:hypothetical protein